MKWNATDTNVFMCGGVVRDLRINSRWIKGCTDKLTDAYPLILIEGGKQTYWNDVKFLGKSWPVVSSVAERSVRMRTMGSVICR